MFGSNPKVTISSSLELLINIIVNTHFQDARCIIQMNTTSYHDYSLTTFSNLHPVPRYVNLPSKTCVQACDHYILHDPLRNDQSNGLIECLKENREYTFRAIIFLEEDNIEDYKLTSYDNVYAAHAIFVKQVGGYFHISAFNHWSMDSYTVLDRWSIAENRFEVNGIEEFFSDARRKRTGGSLMVESNRDDIPLAVESLKIGSEVNMMREFAKSMNLHYEYISIWGQSSAGFKLGYLGHMGNDMHYFPVTHMTVCFLVPKPKIKLNWLKLLQVFKLDLWLFVIGVYVSIGLFFWAEHLIYGHQVCPGFTAVFGIFLQQGLNDIDIPNYLRARCLLGTLFILTVLYSAVFSSGVVPKMMTVDYDEDIRTMADLAKSNLKVEWINDPRRLFAKDQYTADENTSFARYVKGPLPGSALLSYTEKATVHYYTITKLTTALSDPYMHHLEYVKSMDVIFMTTYTSIALHQTIYLLYLPMLKDYVMRVQTTGLMWKWEWDAFRATNNMSRLLAYLDTSPPDGGPIILHFEHIRGVLAIWVAGIAISICVFILENITIIFNFNGIYV